MVPVTVIDVRRSDCRRQVKIARLPENDHGFMRERCVQAKWITNHQEEQIVVGSELINYVNLVCSLYPSRKRDII